MYCDSLCVSLCVVNVLGLLRLRALTAAKESSSSYDMYPPPHMTCLRVLTAAKEAPDHLYFSGHPRQHAEWEKYYQDKAQILFFLSQRIVRSVVT